MTKSVLFPQKKTSSRLAALWQLLKTALCAIALLLTLGCGNGLRLGTKHLGKS